MCIVARDAPWSRLGVQVIFAVGSVRLLESNLGNGGKEDPVPTIVAFFRQAISYAMTHILFRHSFISYGVGKRYVICIMACDIPGRDLGSM